MFLVVCKMCEKNKQLQKAGKNHKQLHNKLQKATKQLQNTVNNYNNYKQIQRIKLLKKQKSTKHLNTTLCKLLKTYEKLNKATKTVQQCKTYYPSKKPKQSGVWNPKLIDLKLIEKLL